MAERLNLDKPRWDQSTYLGRAKHFFNSTDPRTVLVSTEELYKAKQLVDDYRKGEEPAGTTDEQVWRAKKLVDSAFHPQSGELMFLPGRMSFQVPGNMTIIGCMLTFYRSTPAVVFWQWVNQSFNAVVNYTNRDASGTMSNSMLLGSYAAATTASVSVAILMNRGIARSKFKDSFIGRLVPLTAVCAANCVNIPLMRSPELREGTDLHLDSMDGPVVGKSAIAGRRAISEVVPSRIFMAIPGMAFVPYAMHHLETTALLRAVPLLIAPSTVLLNGLSLVVATPLGCALFPQQKSIKFEDIEPEVQEQIRQKFTDRPTPKELYYNKGL